MKIAIAQRLRPFSHRLGTQTLIPFTDWQATIYPTRVVLQKIEEPSTAVTIDWQVEGPFKSFTVELDLEKGFVQVFGFTPKGYMRYQVDCHANGIRFTLEKLPVPSLSCCIQGESKDLKEKEEFFIPIDQAQRVPVAQERLSLGSHKAQDIEGIWRRFDLKEIFPLLLRLGSFVKLQEGKKKEAGTLALLESFEKALSSCNKLEAYEASKLWCLGSFHQMFVPVLEDPLFQGIVPSSSGKQGNPLVHLIQGAHLIRSCFFKEEAGEWKIFPCLFPAFASGRYINYLTKEGDLVDLEWSKHQIKKMVITPHQERLQALQFPKEIRRFRLRKSLQEKGRVVTLESQKAFLEFFPGTKYFLDRFEK